MSETIRGQIKLNDKTEGHVEALRSQGYQVEVNDSVITVEGTSVVKGPVDLTTPEKAVDAFRSIARNKQLCTYGTHFTFPGDGNQTRWAYPAINALSRSASLRSALGFDPSCLVASVASARARKSQIAFPEGVSKRREKRTWLAEQLGVSPDGLSLGVLTKQFLERNAAPTSDEVEVTQDDIDNLNLGVADLRARMSAIQTY